MRRSVAFVMVIVWAASVLIAGVPQPASAQEDVRTFALPNRISFDYSLQIAQDAVWQRVPASHDIQTPTGPIPEYTEITFQNYSDGEGWLSTGQFIRVYPVLTFPTEPTEAPYKVALEDLRAVLAARPTLPDDDLPMLPTVTASQLLRAQVQYLDFANGSGIRYVTAAGLDVSPLSDQVLFYTFQGLTADGAYYVAAQFPVQSGVLPTELEALNTEQYNEFAAGYADYLAEVTAQLNALSPESFNPSLTALDNLFASLHVSAPAATIVTPPDAASNVTVFDNIQFNYDAALASRIEVDVIDPIVDTDGMTMFGSQPGMTELALIDFPVARPYGNPVIQIIPVDTFPGTDSISDQRLAELQAFLAASEPLQARVNIGPNQPAAPEIPVLPVVNAAQVVVVKPAYLDFQNGRGVRFIAYYAQDLSPITNNQLAYYFQGLTSDGRYVVSVQLPLHAPLLPDSIDYSTFDYEGFAATYQTYLADTVAALDALAPSEYTPDLAALDALVQSLSVG